jgi:hypothetical protein
MITGTITVRKEKELYPVPSSSVISYAGFMLNDKVILKKERTIYKDVIGTIVGFKLGVANGEFNQETNRFEPIQVQWANGNIMSHAQYDLEKIPVLDNADKEKTRSTTPPLDYPEYESDWFMSY